MHIRSIDKDTQMCYNRQNMHILFDEQAVYERATKW